MRKIWVLANILCFCIVVHSQSEFQVYENGLIYSDTTMTQLKSIVSTYNLKFKSCNNQTPLHSTYQTVGRMISIKGTKSNAAKADIDNGISWDEFIKKYPGATIFENVLFVRFAYVNYKEEKVIEISQVSMNGYGSEFNIQGWKKKDDPMLNEWEYHFSNYGKDVDHSLTAAYFNQPFTSNVIDKKYADYIHYADCMIDTTTSIYLEGATESGYFIDEKENPEIKSFLDYIHQKTNYPEKNWEKISEWRKVSEARIDSLYYNDPEFKRLIEKAVKSALKTKASDDELEDLVAKYYSSKDALTLKRGRIVYGQCSMDDRPRQHALNIAVLAAKSVSWEVFLRAHLDIMNDNFNRMSDGSYAWGRRETYIKELELLGINVTDLLLGVSMRAENVAHQHYWGNTSRIGRALAETAYKDEFETKVIEMIKDPALDGYNRVIAYFLYANYLYHVGQISNQDTQPQLKEAAKYLPDYLFKQIEFEK